MLKYLLVISLLIPSLSNAQNNNLDLWGKKYLTWDNKEYADDMSDLLRNGLIAMPLLLAALQPQENWKKVGQTAGVLGVNFLSTSVVKHLTKRERPDSSNNLSFYSGHASTAMAGATLSCFFTDKATCLLLNITAVSVAYLRVASSRHWITDVIFGLGAGYANGQFIPTLLFRW